MKKLKKMLCFAAGFAAGLIVTRLLLALFPECMNVADIVMILSCAFFAALFEMWKETPLFQKTAYLYWLVVMSAPVSLLMYGLTSTALLVMVGYAMLFLLAAYAVMRVQGLIDDLPEDAPEVRLLRYMYYDDLCKRFFNRNLSALMERGEEDEEGEDG